MQTAFIPYITAGDPDLATTAEALRLLDALGAHVIELGMSFSDPSAARPTIQASAARTGSRRVARRRHGDAEGGDAGAVLPRGLIVPDLPFDEMHAFRNEVMKNNLELVLLTTPSTPAERMKEITEASEGFIYLVSIDGVTGARANVNPCVKETRTFLRRLSRWTGAIKLEVMSPCTENPDEGSAAVQFHMPPICSLLVRPGWPVEAAPVISKALQDVLMSSGM